jgi:hypothetical protein
MAERVDPADDPRAWSRRPPAVNTLRIGFLAVAVLSLIGSYVGIRQYLGDEPVRAVDIWYYAFQLYVLETPPSFLNGSGPYPPLLEVTRFTAPVVTIYAVVETVRVVVTSEMRRRRARWAHGHSVVCGAGPLAACLTRRLAAAGQRVVTIVPGRADAGGAAGGPARLAVSGDARDPLVLRDAGALNAAAVYACAEDSGTNIAVADAMGALVGRGRAPAVYAHIADPELCLALQARHLGSDSAEALRVDFFNVDDLAARNLCATNPLAAGAARVPTVIVIGANTFARALLVELGRQWWVQGHADTVRLRVVLVDDAASRTLEELGHRYSFLPKACDLVGRDDGEVASLPADTIDPPPDRVVICHADGERALRIALSTAWLWRGGPGSVLVRQDQLATGGAPEAGRVDHLLDEVSGTMRMFGVVDAACDPSALRDDLVERLARIIHESYLVARRQRGELAGSAPALVPWQDLPERFKAANRAQAADIGRKMRLIGCILAPRVGRGEEHELSPAQVETLAAAEHRRWLAERRLGGWSYGERRDDSRLEHPAVRPWDLLPEYDRERSRDAMRQLPVILGESGFRIIRR